MNYLAVWHNKLKPNLKTIGLVDGSLIVKLLIGIKTLLILTRQFYFLYFWGFDNSSLIVQPTFSRIFGRNQGAIPISITDKS